MIVGEIEENDDKVRSVYVGSVEQTACLNLARSCAPKPSRVPKPGRRSHAEARPGRVRRSLAAGRVPKPGRAPVTARRGPARRRDRDGKDGLDDGRDHLCMWTNDRPGASFCQLLETNREKRLSPIRLRGISFENREKRPRSTRRSVFSGVCHAHASNYDSPEETLWPCASFGQLSENRGKRLSPIRLRGISWGDENFCLNLFQQSSVPGRADRWVNGESNKEPLT